MQIVESVIENLNHKTDSLSRTKFIHSLIDNFNRDNFDHPLVKKYSPCKIGCSACCHTQVSATIDEAQVLVDLINEGLAIDHDLLEKQARAQDDPEAYQKLSFEDRKCVFLDSKSACRVYDNRPSVCRTNAVLGEASQCDTSKGLHKTVLVKTPESDMVIYAAFKVAQDSGVLSRLINQLLKSSNKINDSAPATDSISSYFK